MCGIIGFWDRSAGNHEQRLSLLEQCTDSLAHRGPDERGLWHNRHDGVYFGHRRLSIVDLSPTGRQPMVSRFQSITYNGEIYNHIELRKALIASGHSFAGTSDTEVILVCHAINAETFPNQLRGMFAFALWDDTKKTLLLARDRLGKKPLYYAMMTNGIAFASEIDPLRKILKGRDGGLDMDALHSYLENGSITGQNTIYRSIRELNPGCLLKIFIDGRIKHERFWTPALGTYHQINHKTAIIHTERLLNDSIALRLRADVPVGILLSGGIDSGLIASLAARNSRKRIHTFSLGFNDPKYDERESARRISATLGTEHHEYVATPDDLLHITEIIESYGEPFADPSAIPTYIISKFAAKSLKVVLSGDGGDELFGGYRRHLAAKFSSIFARSIGLTTTRFLASALLPLFPSPGQNRNGIAFAQRLLRGLAAAPGSLRRILADDGFSLEERKLLFKDQFSAVRSTDTAVPYHELTHMLRHDLFHSLPEALLTKMDIASMRNGLEVRSPLLDHQLVEWAIALPSSVVLPGFKTKPILRRIARKHLPPDIVDAPKRGFEMPLALWLETSLKSMCHDLILDRQGIMHDLFSRPYLESLLNGQSASRLGSHRWAQLVWTLLALAIWDHSRSRAIHA